MLPVTHFALCVLHLYQAAASRIFVFLGTSYHALHHAGLRRRAKPERASGRHVVECMQRQTWPGVGGATTQGASAVDLLLQAARQDGLPRHISEAFLQKTIYLD